jgi:dCTP deaminase
MPLSDVEIRECMASGDLQITPFDEEMLQPASYDLKLGKNAATVPKNGDPRIDLEKEGVLMIPGYAPAVIYSNEELRLSTALTGRFGIKSALSRRGLIASVGLQIDPGFEGALSVTLMNLTPNPVALNFGDSFLTVELDRLGKPASKGYSGAYQRRKTFTAQELTSVIGFKGHALSDVVHGFDEIREAVMSLTSLSDKFDDFLTGYSQQNEEAREFNQALLREMKKLVEHIAGDRPRTILLRAVPRDIAKKEILELFKRNKGHRLFYSDVAEQLSLDLELVVELCTELENEGRIGVLTQHETGEA